MKILFLNYTLNSGVHVQNLQVCYIGILMPWCFAATIPLSSTLGISPVIPPIAPTPCYSFSNTPTLSRPQCVMFPSLCPCIIIVQHPRLNECLCCLIFCSCVSLLRMMVSRSTHDPAKDMNSSFLWLHSIPWCIYATSSLSSLSLMGIWVGSKSLLL